MVAVDVAIAHRGPRDVAGWSRAEPASIEGARCRPAGYVLPILVTDALATARPRGGTAAMTHAVHVPDVTDAELPAIPFRNRSSFVPLSVLSTLARMDALHPPGPDGSIGANPRSMNPKCRKFRFGNIC